ncbi:ATP-binding protein [Streptomyces aureocirculatus]|uniref:ATP-binding protein n=1 Tax=Streptomyces aureocirculatus TaxID=67275 RepID=UPI0007C55919|nr:ATP-binding protein [Streptomyces aureocirculatus]
MSMYEQSARGLRCVLPFEAAPAELSLLREAVKRNLEQWGAQSVTDEAELVATELATNVIKHVGAGAAATLVLEPREDRLRVEVHDKSHVVPTLRMICGEEECGRGLHLLAALCEEWGTVLEATGKAVWCELSLEPARVCMRGRRAVMVLEEYRRVAGAISAAPTFAVLEESVTDVIADLLHWLVAQGGDPDEMLGRARMHFEAEAEADVEADEPPARVEPGATRQRGWRPTRLEHPGADPR